MSLKHPDIARWVEGNFAVGLVRSSMAHQPYGHFSEPANYIPNSLLDRSSWLMHKRLKLKGSFLFPLKTCLLSVLCILVNGTIIHTVSKLTHEIPWVSLMAPDYHQGLLSVHRPSHSSSPPLPSWAEPRGSLAWARTLYLSLVCHALSCQSFLGSRQSSRLKMWIRC